MRPILVTLALVVGLSVPPAASFEMRPEADLAVRTVIPFEPSAFQRSMHDVWLEFGYGSLWMLTHPDLLRIDPASGDIIASIKLPGVTGPIRPIAFGGDAAWIADSGTGNIYKVDVASNRLVLTKRARLVQRDSMLGFGDGSLWLATAETAVERTVTRLDAATGEVEAQIAMPEPIDSGVLFAAGAAWAISGRAAEVYRIDPATNAIVATIGVHETPGFAAAAADQVFVNSRAGWVDRIDAASNAVTATIKTKARGYEELAFDGQSIWLANAAGLFQIDPLSASIVNAFGSSTGVSFYQAITSGDGSLWSVRRNMREIIGLQPPED